MASESDGGGNNGGQVHDLTIEILKGIREEVRGLRGDLHTELGGLREEMHAGFASVNERIDQTNVRLDQTNERLDQANGRLDVHSQALVKLIGEVGGLNRRFDNFLTGVHRDEHEELRSRIERIEERLDKAG